MITMTITLFFSGGETEQLLASRQSLLRLPRLQPPSNIASGRLVLRYFLAIFIGMICSPCTTSRHLAWNNTVYDEKHWPIASNLLQTLPLAALSLGPSHYPYISLSLWAQLQ